MSSSITLFTPVKQSAVSPLGNYTVQMRDWRDRTRATGGYWSASAEFWKGPRDRLVSLDEAWEMFTAGMQRRVVRSVGSVVMWEGMIYSMTLTHNGRAHVRTFMNAANAVKGIYSRMGSNTIINGSAELGAMNYHAAPVAHPASVGVSAAWSSEGAKSWHIINDDPVGQDQGISLDGFGTLTTGRTYILEATVNITESGVSSTIVTFEVVVGGAVIYRTATEDGVMDVIRISASFESSATGTPAVRAVGDRDLEFYLDGVKLYEAGTRSDTGWYTDDASIAMYGRIEEVLLDAGSTDDAAISAVQRYLREHAWMWPTPPESDFISNEFTSRKGDGLSVEFAGYVQTLPWSNVATYGGVATASENITYLLADAEFVSPGDIDLNTLSTYVEQGESVRLWDEISKIIKAGAANGVPWMGGVYANRLFNYVARPTTVAYFIRNGRWYTANGNSVEPELVTPGYVCNEDLPPTPGTSQGDVRDDPRVFWMDEVEFVAPAKVIPHYSER